MPAPASPTRFSVALLLLRFGIGTYMLSHGWGKAEMLFAGQFDQFGDPIGLANTLSLLMATIAEFLCSLPVILGLFTRLAAIPLVLTMAVAAFVVHASDPWGMGEGPSKEPAILYLVPFAALALTGAGAFSLDATLLPRWRARKGGQ